VSDHIRSSVLKNVVNLRHSCVGGHMESLLYCLDTLVSPNKIGHSFGGSFVMNYVLCL
jgi:hypothetical protein